MPVEDQAVQQAGKWLARWGLESADISLCDGGVDNESYRVNSPDGTDNGTDSGTDSGTYILTRVRTLSASQLRAVLDLMRQLKQHGLPVAQAIPTSAGEAFILDGERPVLLQQCLSGTPASEELEISAQLCHKAGEILARLHTADLQPEALAGEDWLSLASVLAEQYLSEMSFAQQQLCQRELRVLQQLDGDLPAGVLHNDMFCDNVLIEGGEVSGLIDWYSSCRGQYVADLGMALVDWAWDPVHYAYSAERARAMIAGYQSVRPLSGAEARALPQQVRACALVTWLFRIERAADGRELPQERRPEDMVRRMTALPALLAEELV